MNFLENNVIDKKDKEGVFIFRRWEWTSEIIQCSDRFYKLLIKEKRLIIFKRKKEIANILIHKRKQTEFMHLRNGENIKDNYFIKTIKLRPFNNNDKEKRSLLIYRAILNEKNSVSVELKLSVNGFYSVFNSGSENNKKKKFIEEIFLDIFFEIYEDELQKVKYIYSVHLLHMRTLQRKYNDFKIPEKKYQIYLENYKKSVKDLDFSESISNIPSPSQFIVMSQYLDKFKKSLNFMLNKDYKNFQKDNKEYINFSLVLSGAYYHSSLKLKFLEFSNSDEKDVISS